jgi:predicted kinase
MTKLVLINGPMGAGKTTLSKMIAAELGYLHLNIDELKQFFKQWPAGYDYKSHLPVIKEYAFQIVKSNLTTSSIIVDKSLNTEDTQRLEKLANELGAGVVKIMLWVNLETAKERVKTRSGSNELIGEKLEMVIGSHIKAEKMLKKDASWNILDSSKLEIDEVFLSVVKLIYN